MKILFLWTVITLGTLACPHNSKEAKVWICNSSSASAYHASKNCRGLNRCKAEIIEIKISEAKNDYGRVGCKICY